MARKPFRVSITGVDGSGKDAVARLALQQISADNGLTSIKIGRPSYRFEQGGVIEIYKEVIGPIDRRHRIVGRRGDPHAIVGVGILYFLTQSRLLEADILESDNPPDILASGRDPRIDVATYLSYYAPAFVARTTAQERFDIMQALTGAERDLVIRLLVEPHIAEARIAARIQVEEAARQASGQTSATARDKGRPHEDAPSLAMLNDAYVSIFDALATSRPETTIVEIDTNCRLSQDVADLTKFAILQTRDGAIGPGERRTF